jgi:hypothetical protein
MMAGIGGFSAVGNNSFQIVFKFPFLFQFFNRHSREGGNPKPALLYGFPPSRE